MASPWMKRPGQNVQVPTNAPFGGSQGTATVPATPNTPAPAPTPAPSPAPKTTPKPAPTPKTPSAPTPTPAPARGAGGSQGLIIGLGTGLIVVNAVFGDNSGSLLKKVWQAPIDQKAEAPVTSFFPIVGEVIFLVILATLARFSDTSRQLVLTFLIGLWLLWLMFKFPAVYKAGIAGTVGQLFSQGTVSSPGTSQASTTQASSQPAFGQPYAISVPRQGGSPVGAVPHQAFIMG